MDGDHSAQIPSRPTPNPEATTAAEAQVWALAHFGAASLGDARRGQRLAKLAAAMAQRPAQSLPQQLGAWSDLVGAYRFLSNNRVAPQAIQGPHRELTRGACVGQGVILSVQDTTELDFTTRRKVKGLGPVGGSFGRGMLQHTALGVRPDGTLLGILAETWRLRVAAPPGETVRQRQARATEADLWADTADLIGAAPAGCRLVQVGDRGSDCFRFFTACRARGHGFLVRAKYDRYINEDTAQLWAHVLAQPVAGERRITLPAQRGAQGRVVRKAGEVVLAVRYAPVLIGPPRNDPRSAGEAPLRVWAVHVLETQPPAGVEPLSWMLLTSEPVEALETAQTLITWYTHRWVIEEWHKALKEGCRLEATQLDNAADIQRLAAVQGGVAVRLLQLRDLADPGTPAHPRPQADDPQALARVLPAIYIRVVAALAKTPAAQLTPRLFWRTVALRGGWLGRTRDGRPGWKTLWRGWSDVQVLCEGARLFNSSNSTVP